MSRRPSDEAQFEQLFDANFDDLWRFARRRCATSSDADDITAQVFAVAWRRRDDLPGDASRLWLFGVARHVLANHRRSDERSQRLRLRLAGAAHIARVVPGAADDARIDRLVAALMEMSPDDREVVLLRYWDELAVTEIAELLGRTPNAVSMRLHKARRRLAAAVTEKDPPPGRHVSVDPRHRDEDDDALA